MTKEEHIDPEEHINVLQKDLALTELFVQASVEAIQHVLNEFGNYASEDAIQFLRYWNEGNWQAVMDYYPEFDIRSEAQQALINASGGMPT